MPLVSVIIPSNRHRQVIDNCLRALACQRFALGDMQVIVVRNGEGDEQAIQTERWPFELIKATGPASNVGAARNIGFDRAMGEFVILLNDDVRPDRDLVAAHVNAHRRLDRPAMVLGEADWRRCEGETVFDCMLRSTSMVFFYDRMTPHAWYNYRHAWSLNLSLPRRYCELERFDEAIQPVCFDDLEWAFRLERVHGLGVWFAPEARAVHDHRYTLESYLDRERHLGRMAGVLWRCHPECYTDIYGSALDECHLDHCRRSVADGELMESDMRKWLERVVSRPIEALCPSNAVRQDLVRALYLAHLPLKRMEFDRGLLESSAEQRATRQVHPWSAPDWPGPPSPAPVSCPGATN